jgi:hypothetical protein
MKNVQKIANEIVKVSAQRMDDKARDEIQKILDPFYKKGWKKFWTQYDKLHDLFMKYRSVPLLEENKISFENLDRFLNTVDGYMTVLANDIESAINNIESAEKRQKE